MTGQMPSAPLRVSSEEIARDNAKKAGDIANDVQRMSTTSLVSRSKANVLQLEAKSLQTLLDKKLYASAEDKMKSQQLLQDVTALRDTHVVKRRKDTEDFAAPKRRPKLLFDLHKYADMRRPYQHDSSEDTAVRDESVKDEEGRALLRRSSIYTPNTGRAVVKPDAGIAAIVAQKVEEKAASAGPSPRRSPALSRESVGRTGKAPVLATTGKHRVSSASSGTSRNTTTGRQHTAVVGLQRPSAGTLRTSRDAAAARSSPKSSRNPSPTPSSQGRSSPTSSKRGSPTHSRQPSPAASQLQMKTVQEHRTEALSKAVMPASLPNSPSTTAHTANNASRQEPSSRHVTMSPSMIREKDELGKVIKNLLKSAEADTLEGSPEHPAVFTDALVATILASDTRSAVDSDNPYTSLCRSARKDPTKFVVRTCCSLVLLGLAVVFVAVTIIYGNRALARYGGGRGPHKLQGQHHNDTHGDGLPLPGNHKSGDEDHISHVSLRDLSDLGDRGTMNVTAEAPYYNDEILDIS